MLGRSRSFQRLLGNTWTVRDKYWSTTCRWCGLSRLRIYPARPRNNWKSMKINGNWWKSMKTNGNQCKSTKFYWIDWFLMMAHGRAASSVGRRGRVSSAWWPNTRLRPFPVTSSHHRKLLGRPNMFTIHSGLPNKALAENVQDQLISFLL